MFYFVLFLVTFFILFAIASGGIPLRMLYAFKVSSNFYEFVQNYALSYQITYDQIHSTEPFMPEVNSRMEKLLSLALSDVAGVGLSINYQSEILRIQKPPTFTGHGYENTLHFNLTYGKIEEEKYCLSPTVFILANKVQNKILKEKKDKEIKNKRNVL